MFSRIKLLFRYYRRKCKARREKINRPSSKRKITRKDHLEDPNFYELRNTVNTKTPKKKKK